MQNNHQEDEHRMSDNGEVNISCWLENLVFNVRNIESDYENFKKECDQFIEKSSKNINFNAQFNVADCQVHMYNNKVSEQNEVTDKALKTLWSIVENLVVKHKNIVAEVKLIQNKVINEYLYDWKARQKFTENGVPFVSSINLNIIQNWCENLAHIIWIIRQQLLDLCKYRQQINIYQGTVPSFYQLQQTVENLLFELVIKSFVVENQPPQVIMTNKKFTTTVRSLMGNFLNSSASMPFVSAKVISEIQAQEVQQTNHCSDFCAEIINGNAYMEYKSATGHLALTFNNIQIDMSKSKIMKARKQKTTSEKVVEKKFTLLFQASFFIGSTLTYKVWTFSLPIVTIVHGSQEPHAWATIFWDNAFSEFNRIPWSVPDKVTWKRLAEALNYKFCALTGRYLSDENLQFLCKKILRMDVYHPDFENYEVSWINFARDPMPHVNFTFWEWFHDIMQLTRLQLKSLWIDGSIIGFIDRFNSEMQLSECHQGTFLLRFSETVLGGITISYVEQPGIIAHLQPFNIKDLAKRSLPDSIRDLDSIHFLYNGRHKNDVFGRYMSPKQTALVDNYKRREFCTMIVKNDEANN